MATQLLDFEQIKQDHPIEQVAERLGLTLKKSGAQLRGRCPSGEEGDRKFVITPAKGVWYSFALGKGGDVLALVQLVNDCSVKEAAQFLVGDTAPLEKPKGQSKKSAEARGGFRALDYLEPDHPAVETLGFDPETAEALGVGFAPRGILKGKVAIPIRTKTGQLAGYVGAEELQLPPKWSL
ncbi:CHC2 zinc finger [Roseovarius tolerans]|uniref:CHC2 zinc finger n=1 Tax=Roseovarius tolerans TaxID=74031 RepID=A0A1H8HDI2_9RHOB|nr:CHC2 zinc finger domain-containing protein [Roseovarius tolerans]SEN54170.1 CHC2 zinc finger [Roseovarius tolerans]